MAEIIARDGNEVTLQVKVKLSGSLLEMENVILDACNEMGCVATTEALQRLIRMEAQSNGVKSK